jgi:hypothetical protein
METGEFALLPGQADRICADAAFPDRGTVIGAGASVSLERCARLERER